MEDNDPVLDMDVFEILQDILEADELRDKAQQCLQEISDDMAVVHSAALPQKSEEMRHSAHRAAGVAAIIGAAQLKGVLNRIEDSIDSGDYALATEYVAKSVDTLARTRQAIEAELS